MKPADIHPGLLLRVINSHGLGAPRGTLATVETVGTSPAGDWLCTVHYHDKREAKRGRLYRSHLWEPDLGRVEVVIEGTQPSRNTRRNIVTVPKRIQLRLPFEGEENA